MNLRKFKAGDFVVRVDENEKSYKFTNDFVLIKDDFAQTNENKNKNNFLTKLFGSKNKNKDILPDSVVLSDKSYEYEWKKEFLEDLEWVNFETFKKDFVKDPRFFTQQYGGLGSDSTQYNQVIQIGTSHNKSLVLSRDNSGWNVELRSTKTLLRNANELASMEDLLENYIDDKSSYTKPLPEIKVDDYDGSKWTKQPTEEEIEEAKSRARDSVSDHQLESSLSNFQRQEDLLFTLLNNNKDLDTFLEFNLIGRHLPKYKGKRPSDYSNNYDIVSEMIKGNTLELPKKYAQLQNKQENVLEDDMGMSR